MFVNQIFFFLKRTNDNFKIEGLITDSGILPITRLNFGRTPLETSSGVHTLGRFECTGQVAVTGMPKSCEDLWRTGHSLSGLYSVMGNAMVESVYCDITKLPSDLGKSEIVFTIENFLIAMSLLW